MDEGSPPTPEVLNNGVAKGHFKNERLPIITFEVVRDDVLLLCVLCSILSHSIVDMNYTLNDSDCNYF